jgi:hypothetical protein
MHGGLQAAWARKARVAGLDGASPRVLVCVEHRSPKTSWRDDARAGTLAGYRGRSRQLIAAGYSCNPEPQRTGKCGRPRQSPTRRLLLYLDRYQDDVLRFVSPPSI